LRFGVRLKVPDINPIGFAAFAFPERGSDHESQ
jgi:hypothetical protein